MEKKQDVPQCPLGHGDMVLEKEWELKGKGDKGFKDQLWRCPTCKQTFRTQRRLEE